MWSTWREQWFWFQSDLICILLWTTEAASLKTKSLIFFLFFTKWWSYSAKGLFSRGPTQSSLLTVTYLVQLNLVQRMLVKLVQYNAVQCSAVSRSLFVYSAEQCRAVQCSAVQCSAVHCVCNTVAGKIEHYSVVQFISVNVIAAHSSVRNQSLTPETGGSLRYWCSAVILL